MCRKKLCKSLLGLALFALPERERKGGYLRPLTVLDTGDSTLRMRNFSSILKGLEIKWELYCRRKNKQINQKDCGHQLI